MLAVLTEWDEFRWLDIDKVADLMARPQRGRRPQPARPGRARAAAASSTTASAAADGPGRRHRRRRLPRLAPLRGAARPRRRGRRHRQPHHRLGRQHRAAASAVTGFTFVEHDVSDYVRVPGDGRRGACTSPARRRPTDFERIPIQILKVGGLGTHNALGLAKAKGARSSSPPPARCTATRSCTRSPRPTGATSTRSARAASTTRPSASPRR